MAKFTALWNYQRKKTGEIVIAEEELQKMLDAAWDAGYNEGRAGTIPRLIPQPLPHTPTCTNSKSDPACNIPGFDPDTHESDIQCLGFSKKI